jgi:anti-anti-sigma factor
VQTDFTFVCRPPAARLRITGELDLATRERLREALRDLRARRCSRVEVDAADVDFVDATSLRVLHEERLRLLDEGGRLDVVAGSPTYLLVSQLAGYDDLRPVATSRSRLAVVPEAAAPGVAAR